MMMAKSAFLMISKWVVISVFALFIGFLAVSLTDYISCTCPAYASDNTEMEVFRAVQQLQPAHSAPVAAAWAGVIYEAGRETNIDPLLLTAIAFRESSLQENVSGDPDGLSHGAMQLRGVAQRFMPRGCDPHDLACNIRGGAAYLQYCREVCGGSWNRWVGAFGMSRCPTESEAAELRSVRRALELYEHIGGRNWR